MTVGSLACGDCVSPSTAHSPHPELRVFSQRPLDMCPQAADRPCGLGISLGPVTLSGPGIHPECPQRCQDTPLAAVLGPSRPM